VEKNMKRVLFPVLALFLALGLGIVCANDPSSPLQASTPSGDVVTMTAAIGSGTGLIKQIAPATIPCDLTDFENVTGGNVPGTNYNEILVSGDLQLAERFLGQTLTYLGDFDVLSGNAFDPLALQIGKANENLCVYEYRQSTNLVAGLGPRTYPDYDAIGEGSVAVLFPSPQSRFTFDIIGANGGSATLNFFRANGSLLDTIVITPNGDETYGFEHTGGVREIAGFSIHNTDPAGLVYDNICVKRNALPIADAGSNQTVEQGNLGGASVTLDGSGSYDPDSDLLTYSWTWTGGSATGINQTVLLPLGTTEITLTLDDGQGTGTDIVEITVKDTTPPLLTMPADVTVEQENAAGTAVPLTATATDVCDAEVEITSDELAIYPLGDTTVTFTATDDSGNNISDTVIVTVADTTPPSVDAGQDITVEQETADGTEVTLIATVSDICDSTPTITWSHGPTAVFPLGNTTVTVTATDASGNSANDTVIVTVEDTTSPEISVAVSPATLWPPNHKMVDITATVTVTDICDADPTVVLTSITSDEPDDARGNGDGKTVNDIQADIGTTDYEFKLRAERVGEGDGRVYTITYTATDASGNSASASATVAVVP
jgi:hypothetical protein